MPDICVFSIQAYQPLGDRLCRLSGWPRGQVEVEQFPDGERYQRVLSPVMGRQVILLGGTCDDHCTLELFDLANQLANEARSLTLVIPYFGYSTMERSVLPGEIVTAKVRARLLSAIPQADLGNHLVFVDLHSAGIPHYLEGGCRHVHLYAKEVIKEMCRELCGDDFVLASTDSGRAAWVESLAMEMGTGMSFVFKQRLSGAETRVQAVQAMVEGRKVIIYDDMIRTGGSLLSAARAYLESGAQEVHAVASHGIFPSGALERIETSGVIRSLAVTDTHPRARQLESNFLKVHSVAPLLVEHLQQSLR
ncbi:MAG: ribose-phosphate pyrophosphokinase [Candidatus Eremiobacteraeota bacterium]|nr:ribose-phosphate pyrophosphokinase [Candidatus Eremiobacteraeota bacterium]MCW5865811.1 ribose-phosphate pyrophosphokinase [Candidatus Eremiobacteraeota bacterium]